MGYFSVDLGGYIHDAGSPTNELTREEKATLKELSYFLRDSRFTSSVEVIRKKVNLSGILKDIVLYAEDVYNILGSVEERYMYYYYMNIFFNKKDLKINKSHGFDYNIYSIEERLRVCKKDYIYKDFSVTVALADNLNGLVCGDTNPAFVDWNNKGNRIETELILNFGGNKFEYFLIERK